MRRYQQRLVVAEIIADIIKITKHTFLFLSQVLVRFGCVLLLAKKNEEEDEEQRGNTGKGDGLAALTFPWVNHGGTT